VDAEHAAREVLSGEATSVPKAADGSVEVLRLIKVARDTAVKARTQAMITLKSVLVTSPDELRAELRGLSDFRLITACAELPGGPPSDPASASRYVLGALAARWRRAGSRSTRRSRSIRGTSSGSRARWHRGSRPRSRSASTPRRSS